LDLYVNEREARYEIVVCGYIFELYKIIFEIKSKISADL